jgi:hypothetical protein
LILILLKKGLLLHSFIIMFFLTSAVKMNIITIG